LVSDSGSIPLHRAHENLLYCVVLTGPVPTKRVGRGVPDPPNA
jgi:hypothetical protein